MWMTKKEIVSFKEYLVDHVCRNSTRIRELEENKVGKNELVDLLLETKTENDGKKCRECKVMDCAMRVMKTLQFTRSNGNVGIGDKSNKFRSALKYNENTNEILIDEEMLMDAIKLANPGQKSRRIRLISGTE